jgi:hypothetical protein
MEFQKFIMDRLTHSTGRPKHLERNLNRLVVDAGNNNAASQEKTTLPTLRNIAEKNEIKLYPFIQQSEYKYKDLLNSYKTDCSSIVESSSSSDEDDGLKKPTSEIILSSRPTSTKEKYSPTFSEVRSFPFFEHMPLEVIRKMLLENLIDLNNLPATEKNLMHFASTSKFNRELVSVLLTEEGLKEVSFHITKSVIPNIFAKLAKNKKAEFTQADIDELVHNWPYLTFDCSYEINKDNFTNKGLQVLKEIVSHPGLKEIRIINNLPEEESEDIKKFQACIINGLELIYSLLSRKSTSLLKVDLIFKNWEPLFQSNFEFKDKALSLIKKINYRDDSCGRVIFGEMNLSSVSNSYIDINSSIYATKFVKIMCNIAASQSAHTISLAGLYLNDEALDEILDEIQQCDNSSLQHLDLSKNRLLASAVDNLAAWLKSDKTRIKNLILNRMNYISFSELDILADALKNNNYLELVVLDDSIQAEVLRDHPIRKDERVKFSIPFKPSPY